MLSFEIVGNGNAIQIYCDREGLGILKSTLEKLQEKPASHVHLRTPASGGQELDEKNPWGLSGVSEVIITTGGDFKLL